VYFWVLEIYRNKLQKEKKFTEIKKGNVGTLEKAVFIIAVKSIDL
jgi:hypothetical protein